MKIEKFKKLVSNLHDNVIHKKKLKHVLNHRLTFKFNQIAWLKPYIDINTNLRKKSIK